MGIAAFGIPAHPKNKGPRAVVTQEDPPLKEGATVPLPHLAPPPFAEDGIDLAMDPRALPMVTLLAADIGIAGLGIPACPKNNDDAVARMDPSGPPPTEGVGVVLPP